MINVEEVVELENHLFAIITGKIGLGKKCRQTLKLREMVNKEQEIFRASVFSPPDCLLTSRVKKICVQWKN